MNEILWDNDEKIFSQLTENSNKMYIKYLYEDYAGQSSELTAILQYTYQSIVVDNNKVKNLLKKISIDEMGHLEGLGTAIWDSGFDPRFWYMNYFNAKYVSYERDLEKILLKNIEDETFAAKRYREQAQNINDPKIKYMLLKFAKDEERHAMLFEKAYNKLFGRSV
ncbi:MAG: manganese catalase family protein [Thermovenabulum sp.]|uniref:manganese catalase family protein n=1 Tax=Thermovenabulum sp. TaxID=3100335 RepID=UPI003C7CCD6D